MANTNLTGNGTVVLNTRLWAGVGEDDTAWLQAPLGSNTTTGTISMGIIDLTVATGTGAWVYDLALGTNGITGASIVGVLGLHNTTTAAGNTYTLGDSTNTLIKVNAEGGGVNGDVVRLTFLYR